MDQGGNSAPPPDEDFDQFFGRMLPLTIRVARRVTGDPWAAEDVAVEALARTHARWSRVAPLPWRDAWPLMLAPQHSPDEADHVVLRAALAAALVHLPRRQRETIVLRYLCDLPEADVAAALGLSTGTVKTHLHRALAALRANIGSDFEEDYFHDLQA
jgi:DNA-directed RNA polymerase specialized sigma24 family protein